MSKTKIYKCPKCSKKSFTETKPNTFKCFTCKHSENLNDLEWNWFVPAIAVGSLIGLFTIIIGMNFSNKISPNNSLSSPTRNQTEIAPALQKVAANVASISEAPLQAEQQEIAKPIAKAISGNRVLLQISGKSKEVLLCGLNSPTSNSPYFMAATSHLQQLLDRVEVSNLTLKSIASIDGLPLVEIYDRYEQISINAQQATSGYVISSEGLAKPCSDRVQILASIQDARTQHKGMWASP